MQPGLHKYTLDIKQLMKSYKESELEPALHQVKRKWNCLGYGYSRV